MDVPVWIVETLNSTVDAELEALPQDMLPAPGTSPA
jgi:hypothetical protein